MKSTLERVPQRIGASWRYLKITEDTKNYGWHRHDEYEIAIHRHFNGTCFIGHHQSDIKHNHMVLIGPGLPHAIYSNQEDDFDCCETHVIWFRKEWIESQINNCHELFPFKNLLFDASQGIQFSPKTAESVVQLLSDVLDAPPTKQIAILFLIISLLIEDKDSAKLTNLMTPSSEITPSSINEKTIKTDIYLSQNFDKDISLKQLADHLYMSESSVRRMFKRHYTESFSQHLKKIRLNVACDLLMTTNLPVSLIIEKVGFDNQANFNRQFKAYKRVTPKVYRESTQRT